MSATPALMIVGRGLLATGGDVRIAAGEYLLQYVVLAAIPVFLFVATLAMSAAIFANAVTRWVTIGLLFLLHTIDYFAYPTARTYAELEAVRAAKFTQ